MGEVNRKEPQDVFSDVEGGRLDTTEFYAEMRVNVRSEYAMGIMGVIN